MFLRGILLALTMLGLTSPAQAQSAVALATDFSAEGNVVELNVPLAQNGNLFLIVWNTGKGQFTRLTLARSGTHSYEMRAIPEWQGHVKVVAVTLPSAVGRIKTPTFSDEVDLLFEPVLIKPS